ncbi:hypothetical protein ACFL4A_04770, partial [bacterium]
MNMKKIVSSALLLTFITVISQDFSYAQALVSPQKTMELGLIPKNLGEITDRYNGDTRTLLYFIQDMHCNKEVQENISKIIDKLKTKHGKSLNIIGVEGAAGPVDTSLVSGIENVKNKTKVVDYLKEKGYVTGAELYDIQNPGQVKIFGIEDEALYRKNFSCMYKSITHNKKINEILQKLELVINRIRPIIYPKELQKFEQVEKAYIKGRMRMKEYINYVIDKANELNIDYKENYKSIELAGEVENLARRIDHRRLTIEAKYVVERLKNVLKNKEV